MIWPRQPNWQQTALFCGPSTWSNDVSICVCTVWSEFAYTCAGANRNQLYVQMRTKHSVCLRSMSLIKQTRFDAIHNCERSNALHIDICICALACVCARQSDDTIIVNTIYSDWECKNYNINCLNITCPFVFVVVVVIYRINKYRTILW